MLAPCPLRQDTRSCSRPWNVPSSGSNDDQVEILSLEAQTIRASCLGERPSGSTEHPRSSIPASASSIGSRAPEGGTRRLRRRPPPAADLAQLRRERDPAVAVVPAFFTSSLAGGLAIVKRAIQREHRRSHSVRRPGRATPEHRRPTATRTERHRQSRGTLHDRIPTRVISATTSSRPSRPPLRHRAARAKRGSRGARRPTVVGRGIDATRFMKTYLEHAEALDGLEFLRVWPRPGRWLTGKSSPR